MTNENEMSEAELEAATAPEPAPVPPVPENRRVETHSVTDAQPLNVEDYRPEPGTATFKDDRNGEDVELSGEAKSNPDLDKSNFEQTYPKRHVTKQPEPFEPESNLDLETVARQVLAGKWGSGQDRRVLLDRYGYDPNEVQNKSVALLNQDKADQDNHGLR